VKDIQEPTAGGVMDEPGSPQRDVPWQQRLFDSIWLLALLALLYFFLSYAVWGLIDLARVPAGG
jgi:uncharacterized BrkB/YihY/UPF0761 family membrane protein